MSTSPKPDQPLAAPGLAPERSGKNILIVSDNEHEINDIKHLLHTEFEEGLFACLERDIGNLYKAVDPIILIFALYEIGKSRDAIKHFRHSLPRNAPLPWILLLCKATESAQAYDLYRDGLINDFVADRPLFDPYRLRLSVAQAMNSHLNLKNMVREYGEVDTFMNNMLSIGKDHQNLTVNAFKQYTAMLSREVDQMKSTLTAAAQGSPAAASEIRTLDQHLQHFQEGSLKEGEQLILEKLDHLEEWIKELKEAYPKPSRTPQCPPSRPIPGKVSPLILLVDDDDFYRETLILMLEESGMKLLGVDSGAGALELLARRQPDLILLDYKMPEMDGIELLRTLKADNRYCDIPVIMLTGLSSREVVGQSIALGADDFVVKPGERATLLRKIKHALH